MEINRPRAFLDVTIDASPAGRLVLELFSDKTPKTCENFLALCNGTHEGLSYALAPFHRVVDEFMIQGGDITKGDGTGGTSIYGGEFEDENLTWREADAAGLVCMANRGPGTNGSQFFITLEPAPHLNGKHTIFARLVSGQDVLTRIAAVEVDKDDRPRVSVLIARCGELERKKRAAAPSGPAQARGRHRSTSARSRSGSPATAAAATNGPGAARKRPRRRRSDAGSDDETFRGRPRSRSVSRSPRRAGGDVDRGDAGLEKQASPPRKHRRVRSRSPSRDSRAERRDGLRRSRSRSGSGHEGRRRRHDDRDRVDQGVRERGGGRRDRRRDDRGRGGFWDRDRGGGRQPDDRRGYSNRSYRGGGAGGRLNDGRLGDDGSTGTEESGIKFKGRGSMKFREPDRAW